MGLLIYGATHSALQPQADLAETQPLVEKEDRRCVIYQADVREPAQVRAAVDGGWPT